MTKAVILSIGAGLISAAFTLSMLLGSIGALILAYLAPLPLFLIGFMLGTPASLIATGAGALTVGLATNWYPALAFIATTGAPVCLIVRQALLSRQNAQGTTQWYPPGHLLLWLAGYVLALSLLVAMLAGWFVGDVHAHMIAILDEIAVTEADTAIGPYVKVLFSPPLRDTLLTLLPGAMASSWLLLMFVNGILAQGAVAALNRAQRPSPRMADIELPVWASLALIAALAGATLFDGALGLAATSVTLVGLSLFMLAGLGVIHAVMAGRPMRLIVLTGLYTLLVILFWPVFFIAGIAVLEPWARLRQRLAVPPSGGQ